MLDLRLAEVGLLASVVLARQKVAVPTVAPKMTATTTTPTTTNMKNINNGLEARESKGG